ncbi:MAG: FAD-containing oxidoreductase [Bacteroidales bacterium]|nr:FAD-containing oxidoreductase [Bacteroidales bacterium]MDT8430119.1 FAD-containing oxidoreductase [Bacteroidales bacterium]
MKNYDAIIIGSGQAGTPLAFKYASQKKHIAFIEKEHFGGTCLNVGCTPTKAYVASARRMFDATHGEALGIHIPEGATVDLVKVKARKDALIKKSVDGMTSAFENNKYIHVFRGTASFNGPKEVVVNGQQLTAEKIYINVGARARIPSGFEHADVLTNKEILQLEEVPEHLIIVGGSYIGLEFGQMFRRFGSKVTIIEKSDRLIGREDPEISGAIKEILEKEGVEFRMNATCLSGATNEDGHVTVKVDCTQGAPEISGTHLLLAVGRVPNTDTLNTEVAGIDLNDRGFIAVNDQLETNVPGIYALGDCNGKGAFTHTAYNDFEIVAENLFEGKERKVSDRIVTYALFIDPPLGRAGMTLAQAKKSGRNIKTGTRKMQDVARAREKGETDGFMQVIVDSDTDRILGAAVLGVGGDEVISSILNVMYADRPYTVIRDSVQVHPTVSELIPTMLESLQPATN